MTIAISPSEITLHIARVMAIEDTTLGNPQQRYQLRARGHLLKESGEAYEELANAIAPNSLFPVFRQESGNAVIYIFERSSAKNKNRTILNIALFFLTVFSVLYIGTINRLPAEALPPELLSAQPDAISSLKAFGLYLLAGLQNLPLGLPFAISLMVVLITHELGHYFAGRINHTPVTLPFFIPLPIPGSFGTMGAVIAMREPPRNRNRLIEIAIAGPLAGFLVGLPLLLLGLSLSKVEPLPMSLPPGWAMTLEGNSITYLLAKLVMFGRLLPAPAQYDIPPVLFWLRSFFTGFPLPMAGEDVTIHPLAMGAWVGLMITGLNLVPAGQLDGGHMLYGIFGERSTKALSIILAALVVLGFFWSGWFLWVILIFAFGRQHAEPLDTISTLDGRHRALAILGLILFVLLFTPIPMQVYGG